MSDRTYQQDIQVGDLTAARGVSDPVAAVRQGNSRIFTFRKLIIATGTELVDAMAADVTAECRGFLFPFAGLVTSIKLTLTATTAGHATDAFTMTVSKRDAAGGTLTTLGTITSLVVATGGFTAWVPRSLTLTNANLQVVAGGACTWSIAKNGAGVAVPTFLCDVTVLDQ